MTNRILMGLGCSTLVLLACASEAPDSSPFATPTMSTSGATAGAAATPPAAGTPSASSMQPAAAASSATVTSDETWSDGKMLAGSVEIAASAKVTIAPGAKISVASGAAITVHGSLEALAKDNHAKLSGTGWMGIVVASAGSLALNGVDIDGAKQAILVQSGNTLAEYNYGTLTGGAFKIDAGGTFATDHAAVKQAGYAFVSGSLKATFLDYSGAGISMGDAKANLFVADSKLTGAVGDFFTASGGQLFHVEYSTVDNSHCPFHFNALSKFEIDHVTTGGMAKASTSGFGSMIYNSEAGPHSISASNLNDPQWAQTRPTAVINVTNTFFGGMVTKAGQVTFSPADGSGNNAQMEPNADAQPRGTPGPG